jgi:hypothetical protein
MQADCFTAYIRCAQANSTEALAEDLHFVQAIIQEFQQFKA